MANKYRKVWKVVSWKPLFEKQTKLKEKIFFWKLNQIFLWLESVSCWPGKWILKHAINDFASCCFLSKLSVLSPFVFGDRIWECVHFCGELHTQPRLCALSEPTSKPYFYSHVQAMMRVSFRKWRVLRWVQELCCLSKWQEEEIVVFVSELTRN